MPLQDFFYDNLNQHFLSDKTETSSSDGKYEHMDVKEMAEMLEAKKIKPIRDDTLKYQAIRGDNQTITDAFFAIRKMGYIPSSQANTEEKKTFVKNQLKFHVSLPEDQYAAGWNLIMPILIEHGVALFKIPHENNRMSEAQGQYGKDITIYAYKNPEKGFAEWQEILTEITQALVTADIQPGYKTARTAEESDRYDRGIDGSNYISYRYDTKTPPSDTEDPCARLKIDVPQPYEPQIFGQRPNAQLVGQNDQTESSCCTNCNIM